MMGYWEDESWKWNFGWTNALTNDELALFHELTLLLDQVHLSPADSDRRRCIPKAASVFTVKSVYVHLQNRFGSEQLDPILEKALKKHWCTNDASKVSIFVWRLLIDKLPTREALFRKGIITNNLDTCCVFCLN
jgi:hypothetical protein